MRAAFAFVLSLAMWSSAAAQGRTEKTRTLDIYAIDVGGTQRNEAGNPAGSQQPASSSAAAASLDYEFFKTKVQPIFLAKRPGHARCIACHSFSPRMRLQPPTPGGTAWNEEQSRENFETVRRMVVPGSLRSRLLVHPLAEEAGGDFYHNGGKHWTSQNDAEWQTLKAWVLGQTAK